MESVPSLRECHTLEATALARNMEDRPSWIFSSDDVEARSDWTDLPRATIRYTIPVIGTRGCYGMLTCILEHEVDSPPPSMQETRRYLVFPLVAALEGLPDPTQKKASAKT